MTQSAFATALMIPDAPLPQGVIGPDGRPDAKRFAVYRNNVTASLTRVLEGSFPVVRKLVGDEFFVAMAVVFLSAHPPRQCQLMLYGAEFADFLQDFPPVAHLGYLPDIARLEQALRDSYHAADSQPLPLQALSRMSEADLLQAKLHFAPSLRLVRSVWPVHAIWQANSTGGPAPRMQAEEVVILRPEFDPVPQLLPPGGAAVLDRLQAGRPLVAALAETSEGFDLTIFLGLLLQGRAVIGVSQ